MKKIFLTIGLVVSGLVNGQVFEPFVGAGMYAGNSDADNPLSMNDVREWDNFQSGVKFGDWMTDEQLAEFSKRTDARLFGAHLNVGTYVNVFNYELQGVDYNAGIAVSAQLYKQTDRTIAIGDQLAVNPSAGIFFETGFRTEVGVQKYADGLNWYLDLWAPIVSRNVGIYGRYQRSNPFVNQISGVWALDGSPITLESFSAGIRIKF